ncbi:hypothetical protein ILYODFUR_033776 [Ilyodon furcidens]|uniref:Uncharacterized protein n=1 Tax=Ilyodon furcidens TaxID=33524 RepID=A0ABV0TRZ6_9TELE
MDLFFWGILDKRKPPNLCVSRQNLSQNTASFIQLCDSNEASMRRILDQLQDITATVEHIQKETTTRTMVGAAVAAFGALLAVAGASATNGVSVAVYGAAAVCGVAALLCFIIKQKLLEQPHVNKMIRLTEEFRLIVKQLKNSLERVKCSCGDLRRELVGAEAIKLIRLEINILEQFCITEKLRTFAVLQQAQVVERVFEGFRRMKTDLQTFYT